MRVLRHGGWLVVAAGGALLILSAPAPAKPTVREPTPLFSAFELRGSNGYEINALAIGNLVLLQASLDQVAAAYSVTGWAKGNRIRARFGNLGRIAVEFHAPEGAGKRRNRCSLVQQREFRGTIAFRGEGGYTRVDATRADGWVFTLPESPACFGGTPPGAKASSLFDARPSRATTRLDAISRGPRGIATVTALGFPGRSRIRVEASLEERRGEMDVFRAARALVGGRSAFASSGVDVHPRFAFLGPSKPFSGTATFEETSESSSSWSGDLAAWLPGLGKTSFAGPTFSSSLCRRTAKGPRCPPSPTVQRPLIDLLQESGSQSQAPGAARLSWSR